MSRIYYVYQLRLSGCDQPFYIGKGHGDRAYRHLTDSRLSIHSHKNNTINKAIRDGVDILVEFLRTDITEKQAFRLEKFWIAKIGRADLGLGPLTNHTNGGEGQAGRMIDESQREKISKSNSGKVRSEESRKRYSEANSGVKNPFYGKKHSEEARRKIAEASRRRRASA